MNKIFTTESDIESETISIKEFKTRNIPETTLCMILFLKLFRLTVLKKWPIILESLDKDKTDEIRTPKKPNKIETKVMVTSNRD